MSGSKVIFQLLTILSVFLARTISASAQSLEGHVFVDPQGELGYVKIAEIRIIQDGFHALIRNWQ
jgi:hypothetical protein